MHIKEQALSAMNPFPQISVLNIYVLGLLWYLSSDSVTYNSVMSRVLSEKKRIFGLVFSNELKKNFLSFEFNSKKGSPKL